MGARARYTLDGLEWVISPQPSWGAQMRGDPILAYDSIGKVYFDNMYGSPILGTRSAISTNNGQSWSSVVLANIGEDKKLGSV